MKQLYLQLIAIFLIVQCVGLLTATNLIKEDVQATIVNDNPQDITNSLALIGYILGVTALILIAIKFLPSYYIFKAIELLAVGSTTFIVFSVLISVEVGLAAVLILLGLRFWKKDSLWIRNVASIIAVSGAGALIGVSLDILPVLVFMVLLSIYDLIAVFHTKHMVTMAKHLTKHNLAFTFALPTPVHTFEMGTGDIVVPLIFAASILKFYSPVFALNAVVTALILLASISGLLITIWMAQQKIGRALPALPLQTVLMLVILGLIKLVGF